MGISLFLGLSPFFNLLPESGIGKETIAAAIGVILISLVTQFLLRSQQHIQQQNAQEDEIFRARMLLYQRFIEQFFENISDRRITEAEHKKLKGLLFRIYAIGGENTITQLDALMENMELFVKGDDTDLAEQQVELLEHRLDVLAKQHMRFDLIKEKIDKDEGKNKKECDTSENFKLKQRDVSKIFYNGKTLSKTDFVLQVFQDNIVANKLDQKGLITFEKAIDTMARDAGLDEYEAKHFEIWRSMPIWMTYERAQEMQSRSKEGERWNRYRLMDGIQLKDDIIVVRRGQSSESVRAVMKVFKVKSKIDG